MKKNPGMAFPARGKLKKILWVMKLKIFLILFSCLQLHAAVHSQNAVKISLDLENVSLEEVIWAIEKQTNFVFMYGTNDVEQIKPLTINEKDKEIGEILNICLQNTGLCYEISGNAVIIKKGMPQVEGRKITGKVTDEKGNTLPGVTVLIKGTSLGTVTDADGVFSLTLPTGAEPRLVFSFVGMESQEVNVADKEKYPYILDILKKQFHASPYMERYVMEALFMMDEGSFAIQRMKERYAQMVNNTSYTTLFEGWDIGPNGFGGGTVNHAWSGGPLIVIAQYICGIKPLEPGWRSFEIAPNCDILESADIKVPTIAGKIHSKFCRTDNGVIMDIIVPCGTQALVKVPGPKCKITLINGVEQLCDKGYYFRLGAGKYHIEKKY